MNEEIRKVENYEIINSMHIGGKEIVIGIDMNNAEGLYYMVADCERNELFERYVRPPSKNGHKKASKNEMNRSISLIY